MAVAVASVLVLSLARVPPPSELRQFSEFQYCDIEDHLFAACLHSLRLFCCLIYCRTCFPTCLLFTWATVLQDTRKGGLPWTWLIHFAPPLARSALVCVTSGACEMHVLAASRRYASWIHRRWGLPTTWTMPQSQDDWLAPVPALVDTLLPAPRTPERTFPNASSAVVAARVHLEVSAHTAVSWMSKGPAVLCVCKTRRLVSVAKDTPFLWHVFGLRFRVMLPNILSLQYTHRCVVLAVRLVECPARGCRRPCSSPPYPTMESRPTTSTRAPYPSQKWSRPSPGDPSWSYRDTLDAIRVQRGPRGESPSSHERQLWGVLAGEVGGPSQFGLTDIPSNGTAAGSMVTAQEDGVESTLDVAVATFKLPLTTLLLRQILIWIHCT